MFKMIKSSFLVLILIIFMCCTIAYATEGGGGAYGNGAEGSMSGALPPPGFYMQSYTNFYRADSLKGDDGQTVLDEDDFKVITAAQVFRLIAVTKKKILGGNLGFYTLIPLAMVDVKTPAGSQTKTGLADITLAPFISWHKNNFHWATAVDCVLPTGAYDKNDIANLGRNYYTIEPLVAVTYLSDNGIELSAKFMYDFNLENNDTDYQSGNEFHVDYFVGAHVKKWTFGAVGYYYKQVTDDKQNGQDVDYKGQAMAIGPLFSYSYSPAHFITVKYQKEFEVENRPSGEKIWIKALFAF